MREAANTLWIVLLLRGCSCKQCPVPTGAAPGKDVSSACFTALHCKLWHDWEQKPGQMQNKAAAQLLPHPRLPRAAPPELEHPWCHRGPSTAGRSQGWVPISPSPTLSTGCSLWPRTLLCPPGWNQALPGAAPEAPLAWPEEQRGCCRQGGVGNRAGNQGRSGNRASSSHSHFCF